MPDVVWFGEVGKGDVPLAGGKGANLGELARAGLPVPPGFIVTAPVYARFLQESGLAPLLEGLLRGLDATNAADLDRISNEIKALVTAAPMPGEVASQVARSYREVGGGPVAVRSSATAEDLAQASFAGQQSTYLNVEGEDHVVRAVQACWASLFEPQAIAYRQSRGFDHLAVAIAVVVQRMVQSDRSGVMFTIDPVTGARDRLVIEAVYGLGEAAVSGIVTPDFYVLQKEPLAILDKTVERQERQLVRTTPGGGEEDNAWEEIPPAEGSRQKLTDDEIVGLAHTALRVEAHYGRPQDIEWAAEAGSFYIVQSRPVTAAGGEQLTAAS